MGIEFPWHCCEAWHFFVLCQTLLSRTHVVSSGARTPDVPAAPGEMPLLAVLAGWDRSGSAWRRTSCFCYPCVGALPAVLARTQGMVSR